MATLVNFYVLMWTATLTEGITTHSVTGCSDNVLLNCSITEMIHVERITYYNGTDCNQAVTDLQVCREPLTGSDTGLSPVCNGKVSCKENLYYCPGSKAAKVDYRCIPGNDVKDMCDEIIIKHTNRIFLSTPNYPLTPNFTDISPCRCSIRGSSITSIQMLELILLPSNEGTESSLEINYGDVTYKTESFSDTSASRRVYNKRLSTTSTTARIVLNHNIINTTFLWIEVQGVSMHVSCSNETNTTDDTSSSSSTTLVSPATPTSPSSQQPSSSLLPSISSSQPSSFSSPTFTTPTSPPSPPSSTTPTSPTSSQTVSEEPNIEPSSSTDSSSTTHPPQTADIKSQDSTPVIAGTVVGAVILIAVVITIFIFIYRNRSRNRSSTTKPHSAKMDKNQDEIPMDFPSRGQPDGCEIDEDITRVDNSVDVNHPDQTASPSNTDLVYAVVNKPGRTSSVDRESKSTDPDGTVVDTGSHYVHVDDDFEKGNVQEAKDSSKGNLNQTHKDISKDSLKGNPQGSYEASHKDSPNGDTDKTVFNKSDKSLDGERNSPVLHHTVEDIDQRYAEINDLFKQDSRPSQSEDTPRVDSSDVKNSSRSSRNDSGRSGGIDQDTDHYSSIDQDTDHYSSIDQESDHYSSIDAIGPTDLPNAKPTVSDTDSKVTSDKTQGSSSTRAQEDSSYDPVYSVVNKVKASPKPDDNTPERIVIENELYVPFDDKCSDRIVMENDFYVPLEETLLKTV